MYRLGHPVASRKLPAIAGFLMSACALMLAARSPSVGLAVTCFSAATFGADLTLSPSWAASIDIGRAHTGLLSSAMNMSGNIGSFISALAFPLLVSSSFGAVSYFCIAAGLSALAAFCWWRLNWTQV
jgi:ACS family glucarate transporter-like MFS transporter